jgi:hypothetical protein
LEAVPGCWWPRAGCSAVVPGGRGRLRLVVRAGPGQGGSCAWPAGRGEEAAEDFADAGGHARLVVVGQGQHRPVQAVQEKPGQHAGIGEGERALVHRLAEQAGHEVPQRLPGPFLVSWGLVEQDVVKALVGVHVVEKLRGQALEGVGHRARVGRVGGPRGRVRFTEVRWINPVAPVLRSSR